MVASLDAMGPPKKVLLIAGNPQVFQCRNPAQTLNPKLHGSSIPQPVVQIEFYLSQSRGLLCKVRKLSPKSSLQPFEVSGLELGV